MSTTSSQLETSSKMDQPTAEMEQMHDGAEDDTSDLNVFLESMVTKNSKYVSRFDLIGAKNSEFYSSDAVVRVLIKNAGETDETPSDLQNLLSTPTKTPATCASQSTPATANKGSTISEQESCSFSASFDWPAQDFLAIRKNPTFAADDVPFGQRMQQLVSANEDPYAMDASMFMAGIGTGTGSASPTGLAIKTQQQDDTHQVSMSDFFPPEKESNMDESSTAALELQRGCYFAWNDLFYRGSGVSSVRIIGDSENGNIEATFEVVSREEIYDRVLVTLEEIGAATNTTSDMTSTRTRILMLDSTADHLLLAHGTKANAHALEQLTLGITDYLLDCEK
ncbi:unnamed protein product [Amoebophrya sp. A120]|nr:unnamed protein product [Amoebophrya sp. A120]|eukprot:GSA120T00012623001.1